ncbi:MAG: tRNA pseudouridine(55) synthase TruB [Candidatus Nanosyncoccaceae bacterium]|jgi:tRNA pseudouridine55 synthase
MPSSSSLNKLVVQNDAVILVNKPAGMTSFGVVARLRRLLSEDLGKKAKVGHAGTLDPFASGLLIIMTGQKCREAQRLLKLDKSYRATLTLGWITSTQDPEGQMSLVGRNQPSLRQIEAVLGNFLGEIQQVPPNFSALKVGGKKAYDLARAGKEFKLPARSVTVSQIDIIDYDYPRLVIDVAVSSGAYIRSLARDIGEKLGTGAYCSALLRTSVGKFSLVKAKKLADFSIIN